MNEVPEINSKKVFYSYSKKDQALRDVLEQHLASLKRQQKIETWHDRDLYAGDEWHPTIIEKLESADIILLLVSANFMATDYIYKEEVSPAMAQHEQKKSIVIPILISPCLWEKEPFAKLLALPDKGKAVTQYSNQDEAWTLVAKGIDEIVKNR